jgi:hypothetical protein
MELEVQGTWVGTILVEASNDGGTNWAPRSVIFPAPTQLNSLGVTADGYYRVPGVGSYKLIRARMSAYTSGTATVNLVASSGSDVVGVVNTNSANLNAAAWFSNSGTQVQGAADSSGRQAVNLFDNAGTGIGPASVVSGTNYLPVVTASASTPGSAIPSRSTEISGVDSGGLARNLLTDTAGVQQVSLGTTAKTLVLITGSLSTSTTTSNQVIATHTVTTGKTYYISEADCSVILNTTAATQNLFGTCSLVINGAVVWSQYYKGPGYGSISPTLLYPEPIFATSGQVVEWVTTPGATGAFFWTANFGGYEKWNTFYS